MNNLKLFLLSTLIVFISCSSANPQGLSIINVDSVTYRVLLKATSFLPVEGTTISIPAVVGWESPSGLELGENENLTLEATVPRVILHRSVYLMLPSYLTFVRDSTSGNGSVLVLSGNRLYVRLAVPNDGNEASMSFLLRLNAAPTP